MTMTHARRLPAFLLCMSALTLFTSPHAEATTTCSATMTDLAFGNVDPTGALVNAQATLNYSCTHTGGLLGGLYAAYVRMCFSIGTGSATGSTYNPRRMTDGSGDPMTFQLYRDAARSQIWGSVDNATYLPLQQDLQFTILANGQVQNGSATLYGQVPAGQTGLGVGSYTDPFTGIHTKFSYAYNEALLGLGTFPATCGTASNGTFPFTARADVQPQCRLTTATDLDFGSVPGLLTTNRDQLSTISTTCTYRTAWQIGLNNGQHAVGSTRRMTGVGSYAVNYELYRDSVRSLRWGTTLNTDTFSGTGSGSVQSVPVYGRVPPQTAVAAGNYSDIITVTVTF
jgi:spore coat protein U-like protein